MIEKRIYFSSEHDECSVETIPSHGLIKLASHVSPEIKAFIENNIKSDPRYIYTLVSALGAGEIWGPNINGDYFREKDIIKSYKTFEEFGNVFAHHKNKDPEVAIGKVMFAHWNPRMHRVELILQTDRTKAPRIADDIEAGKLWDVSMGCRVAFDICSICGNKAHTRAEYCVHLKNHMNKILPDGRQVYAINPNPTFFDISYVYVGADRTAKTLMKVAHKLSKQSDIVKDIPGILLSNDAAHMAALLAEEFSLFRNFEEDIPPRVLDNLAKHPIGEVVRTLATLGIVLKPKEFLRIIVKGQYYNDPIIGTDISLPIVEKVFPLMPARSAHKVYLYPRIIKIASRKLRKSDFLLPGMGVAALIYNEYLNKLPEEAAKGVDAVVKEKRWLLPILVGGTAGVIQGVKSFNSKRNVMLMEKNASNLGGRLFLGLPAAYLASEVLKGIDSESKLLKFLREHPVLAAMLGVGITNTSSDWKAIKNAISSLTSINPAKGFGKTAGAILETKASPKEIWESAQYLRKHAGDENVLLDLSDFEQAEEGGGVLAAVMLNNFIDTIL